MWGERFGGRARAVGGLAAALALSLPASALAADAYVDVQGNNANPCTLAQPCATIQMGVDTAGPGDTVRVDPGAYTEGVVVGEGISIAAEEFAGGAEGNASLNSGGFSAVQVAADGAGTISGFSFSSTAAKVIDVLGAVSFTGNTVLVPSASATGISIDAAPGDAITITDSSLFGDSTSPQVAIYSDGANPTITNNVIGAISSGFNRGVDVVGATSATISGNRFQGTFQSGSYSGGAISLVDATATIEANELSEAAAGTVDGVLLLESAAAPDTGAALARNSLYGVDAGVGVNAIDTLGAVTLDGDLVANFQTGVTGDDQGSNSATAGALGIRGATIFGNAQDVMLLDTSLEMDSTVVGTNILTTGASQCAITFSRGPAIFASADGCGEFDTAADPVFVNPFPPGGGTDLHVYPSSPLIDAGNPASPAPGELDLDGKPRALDGGGECPEDSRRDIGAYEFGEPLDCDPPQTKIKGPGRSSKRRVKFRLSSDEPDSSFRCKLDSKPFKACKKRYRTPKLKPGRHKLRVKAIDPAGNEDATAAVKKFRVVA